MKKVDIASYMPFTHENFDLISRMLNVANQQDANKFEGILTKTLIYMNAVDYISSHLIENLSAINSLVLQEELNGTIYQYYQEHRSKSLGKLIEQLNQYEFPNKKDFIEDLGSFVKLRNRYAHNLMKLKPKEIESADKDFSTLFEVAQRLMNTYDRIVKAIRNDWKDYLLNLRERDIPKVDPSSDEHLKSADKVEN